MAQLDLTTYMSQIFWLLLTFFVFYIFVFNFFLPKLSKILKTRNKTIEFFTKDLSTDQLKVKGSETFILNTLTEYKNFLEKVNNQSFANFDNLKKLLFTKYQNYFFVDSVYTNAIGLKK